MCVKVCPMAQLNDPIVCSQTSRFEDEYKYRDCQYYPDAFFQSDGETIEYGKPFRYATELYMGRYCVPIGDDFIDSKSQ